MSAAWVRHRVTHTVAFAVEWFALLPCGAKLSVALILENEIDEVPFFKRHGHTKTTTVRPRHAHVRDRCKRFVEDFARIGIFVASFDHRLHIANSLSGIVRKHASWTRNGKAITYRTHRLLDQLR